MTSLHSSVNAWRQAALKRAKALPVAICAAHRERRKPGIRRTLRYGDLPCIHIYILCNYVFVFFFKKNFLVWNPFPRGSVPQPYCCYLCLQRPFPLTYTSALLLSDSMLTTVCNSDAAAIATALYNVLVPPRTSTVSLGLSQAPSNVSRTGGA